MKYYVSIFENMYLNHIFMEKFCFYFKCPFLSRKDFTFIGNHKN